MRDDKEGRVFDVSSSPSNSAIAEEDPVLKAMR